MAMPMGELSRLLVDAGLAYNGWHHSWTGGSVLCDDVAYSPICEEADSQEAALCFMVLLGFLP